MLRDPIFDVYQDTSGFVWISNFSYLFKYDGLSLTVFDDSLDVIGSGNQLGTDKDGNMLILGAETGLIVKRNDSLIVKKESLGINVSGLMVMASTFGDSLVIGSNDDGLFIVFKDTVVAHYDVEDGIAGRQINHLIRDSRNRIWIATNNGVSVLEKGTITNYDMDSGLPGKSITAIAEAANGDIWVGSEADGIVIIKENGPNEYISTENGLHDNAIYYLEKNPADSSMWIGFYNKGISRYKDGDFDVLNKENGLISDYSSMIRFGTNGMAYVGTGYGLSILIPRRIDVIDEKTEGFPFAEVFSIDQDSSGKIYVGTISEGLMTYENNEWSNTRFNESTSSESISVFKITDKDYSYMVTSADGLVKYQDGKVLDNVNANTGLVSNYVICLEEDKDENIWVGTWDGFNIINADWQITDTLTAENEVPDNGCLNMVSDQEGDIWISTLASGFFEMRGLEIISHYTSDDGLTSDRVYGLISDSKGDIWAASIGYGLYKVTEEGLKSYEGLNDNFVTITEDNDGNFWYSSNGYIAHIKRSDIDRYDLGEINALPVQKFTPEDGFPNTSVSYGNSSLTKKISTGEILVATNKGVAVVNTKKATFEDDLFFPYIESISINEKNISMDNEIFLDPDESKIQISYSALNLRSPSKTMFRTKLEGIDTDWNYVDDRTIAYYDFLPHDDYTFHVSAIGPDGQWNDTIASLSFTVLPPFYRTWWFLTLSLLGFGGLVAWGAQLRSNVKLRNLNRELETQHKIQNERERISRELHDNVGSQISNLITGIEISNLHVKKNQQDKALSLLENLDIDARSAMTDLRETIWLLDKEEIQFGIFLDHLKSYLHRQEHYLKEMKVNIESEIDLQWILNPTQSLNLTRIIQEALNNARKYAEANLFNISFKKEAHNIILTLSDNGIGMNLEENLKKGNGITNMEERAKNMNGTIAIKTAPGKGTSITIIIYKVIDF